MDTRTRTTLASGISRRSFLGLSAGMLMSAAMCGLAGCSASGAELPSSEDGAITLRYGVMTGNVDAWIATVAQQQGYYADNGLNVQVSEYASGINTVDAIATGQLDIGFVADFAGVNRIGNTSGASDLRFLARFSSSSSSKLYVNPDHVSTLSDLRGKGLLTVRGTVWEYWDGLTLQKAGLTSSDVNVESLESLQDAVSAAGAGNGDALWASGANAAKLVEYGWEPILTLEQLEAPTLLFLMSTESFAQSNAQALANFFKAEQQAIDFIASNTDEAADAVYQKNGLSQDQFKQSVAALDLGIGFTDSDYQELDNIKTWCLQNGYFGSDYELSDFIDVDAAQTAFPQEVTWNA